MHRRITEHHLTPQPDAPGGLRITSAAFIPSSDGSGISVNLGDTMADQGISPETVMGLPPPGVGLAFVAAEQVRSEELEPRREPLADDPSHGAIVGDLSSGGRRRRLARLAQRQWVIPLDVG